MSERNIFFILWIITTLVFSWFLYQGNSSFDSAATLYVFGGLFLCTLALMRWMAIPLPVDKTAPKPTRRGIYMLLALIVVAGLFIIRTVIGRPFLFAWPVLALITLLILRPKLTRKEIGYALFLAVVGGITGLGAKWVDTPLLSWGVLQFFLVFTGLLAGWTLLRSTGLSQAGIGLSQFLETGIKSALRAFGFGILLSIPWALGNLLTGGANIQSWVQQWWQPLIALSPGIGEEVWGRIFPIPLLFVLFQRVFRQRSAYIWALFVIAFWFAYLHTPGGLNGVVSTAMFGILYALPLAYICLHRDLETAIGFHFCIDFVKFLAAFLLNTGIWLAWNLKGTQY